MQNNSKSGNRFSEILERKSLQLSKCVSVDHKNIETLTT